MINMGMNCSCSKLLDQIPMMNPNRLNVKAVNNKNAIIHAGWRILIGTNSDAVARMIKPRTTDLVDAAPT